MPPLNDRKVKALRAGTVMLSKPLGERLSTKVAKVAVARAGIIKSETENVYRVEKKMMLTVKLRKLARNMAAEPSKLLPVKNLYLLLPYLSPTVDAALSPYAIGRIPAAIT